MQHVTFYFFSILLRSLRFLEQTTYRSKAYLLFYLSVQKKIEEIAFGTEGKFIEVYMSRVALLL